MTEGAWRGRRTSGRTLRGRLGRPTEGHQIDVRVHRPRECDARRLRLIPGGFDANHVAPVIAGTFSLVRVGRERHAVEEYLRSGWQRVDRNNDRIGRRCGSRGRRRHGRRALDRALGIRLLQTASARGEHRNACRERGDPHDQGDDGWPATRSAPWGEPHAGIAERRDDGMPSVEWRRAKPDHVCFGHGRLTRALAHHRNPGMRTLTRQNVRLRGGAPEQGHAWIGGYSNDSRVHGSVRAAANHSSMAGSASTAAQYSCSRVSISTS